jgi:hypothetical protein
MDPKTVENWKTTIGGIMTALGMIGMLAPPPVRGVFIAIGTIGAALTGVSAKDFNTHSTQPQVDAATEKAKEGL